MPVLRFPNFTDQTADVRLDQVFLRVGNERKDGDEQVITLRDFLADPGAVPVAAATRAASRRARSSPRATRHALVSAQAAFLPVPEGRARPPSTR